MDFLRNVWTTFQLAEWISVGLVLTRGRDTFFRIHGTPQPETIGKSFSSAYVRLTKEHVADLYDFVPVNTLACLF